MLGQRLEAALKSQTLPRLDGQDEESEVLDNQFEILSLANSCPDLTVLEVDGFEDGINPGTNGDVVDGVLKVLNSGSSSNSSFRRSTSLNSLGVDVVDAKHEKEKSNGTNGTGPACVLAANRTSQVIGQLEKTLKKDGGNQLISSDFIRTALRASHGGTTGHLHKSISSPSVTQYFVGSAVGGPHEGYQKIQQRVQSDAHQHSTKRSFFRRKHKSKSNLIQSHPPVPPPRPYVMDGFPLYLNGDAPHSLAFAALDDPSLGLQDADSECWAPSMDPEMVSQLEEKEVKRQEHMYELIQTEKHHCLTLALMQHLFVGDMKKSGFARYTRLLFPELKKLLEIHFSFLRRMRERQTKFRELGQPMDTLTDILVEQFTSEKYHLMIRFYGLLCASYTKSLDIFKSLLKDPKFASLVASWDKESLLGRKNVRECLLLVAQRITKYPILIEAILKASISVTPHEREQIEKSLSASRDLISKVNQRVDERANLFEIYQKIDPKSYTVLGQKKRGREDIISLPSRRLLFQGQAIVNCNRSFNATGGAPVNRNVPCTVLILTDSLVFIQEINLKLHFVSPPGIVMLNNLIVRENAGQSSSLFLVLGTGTSKPEMIDLQVINPPRREIWMEKIRDAIAKCLAETESGWDENEEVDSTDLSDLKVTKALEELQEQDKLLISALRSRARLIESLRTEKPYHWTPNNFEGRDNLLSSLSTSCSEVQKVLNLWEVNNSVNRSTSCVGEHLAQASLLGLPKRADTFGGFDSQQRSVFDLPPCPSNKILMEMVIQLSQLCGDMFSQMLPQLMPSVYQTHNQLQRRMEDLREAQQRLETEKTLFQQDFSSQKEIIERERAELTNLKQTLHKEQEDITQQREQLYRKLEALQRQGMRHPLDPISPISGAPVVEKPNINPAPSRRPIPQTTPPAATVPANNPTTQNGVKSKQQLPMFLASNSSFKAAKGASGPEIAPSVLRNSGMGPLKGNLSPNSTQSGTELSRQPSKLSNSSRNSVSQVQQMLPLRLSEGNSKDNKTSSLPRGMGSRSVSSMLNQMDSNTQSSNPQHQLRPSVSTTAFPYGIHSYAGDQATNPSNSSFLYGPQNNGRHHQQLDEDGVHRNGHGNNWSPTQEGIAVVHRRSGSSPVPMSTSQQPRRVPVPEIHYHQHQHPFFRQREDEAEKILFL